MRLAWRKYEQQISSVRILKSRLILDLRLKVQCVKFDCQVGLGLVNTLSPVVAGVCDIHLLSHCNRASVRQMHSKYVPRNLWHALVYSRTL